eukprot:4373630-Heterocapsa_arctica.AAC.1
MQHGTAQQGPRGHAPGELAHRGRQLLEQGAQGEGRGLLAGGRGEGRRPLDGAASHPQVPRPREDAARNAGAGRERRGDPGEGGAGEARDGHQDAQR